MSHKIIYLLSCLLLISATVFSQTSELDKCNIVWTTQSQNSSQSMPCGGGDIGLNVWVENGDLLFYMSKSGTFDENNQLLKQGRVRISLSPNPFAGKTFRQELILHDGYIKINGADGNLAAEINVWVDIFNSNINLEISSNKRTRATATYESWRYEDRILKGKENNANSWKWEKNVQVITRKDSIRFSDDAVFFYHRNSGKNIFDITVKQQGLDSVKSQLFDPLKDLTSGGYITGSGMHPAGNTEGKYTDTYFKGWKLESDRAAVSHKIQVKLISFPAASDDTWFQYAKINLLQQQMNRKQPWEKTKAWWHQYWERSFVHINTPGKDSTAWQAGRNYQLFRYMLGCNAYGDYPTKFNGGLFTYDPVHTDTSFHYTPDHRNWGGGTFTAQNQRLVYWPMLKSGDLDMMKSQFKFYLRILKNAELRSRVAWNHGGASFTEQMENFGLPNYAEYGLKRPEGFDKGLEYNAWLEYVWDTALEFCMMMLENETYDNSNITEYIPFVKSCLDFFDEHYQYLAKKRGIKTFDEDGHLVLYPGSGAETYKMANNSTSTIAALQTVTKKLLQSKYITEDDRKKYEAFLKRIPPLNFRSFNGHNTISPAKSWERINNEESMQLYPVFPWGIYGVGKPGLDTALNTWKYDTLAIQFRSSKGWKQDNIFAARLGLSKEAAQLTVEKLKNSGRRFPAFWGPGFDWTPDHNWGGSGMIGMQEMLLQTDDKKIFLFPAWPKEWDVHFKLHAPYNTTVEATIKNGKMESLIVEPEERRKDVISLIDK